MKFSANEVKQDILAKLGSTRKLSERSIDEMIVNAMAFAGEETELADFLKNASPMFVTANGNLIKEQSDFVKKWQAENPKTTTTEPKKDDPDFSSLEALAALLDKKLSPLQQELDGYRAERTAESIFSQAQAKFIETNPLDLSNERVKLIQEHVYSTVKATVGKDSKVEDVTLTMKSEFDKFAKMAGVDTPYIPAQQSSGAGSTDATQYAAANKVLQDLGKLPTPQAT